MSRVLDALRRVEAEHDTLRATPAQATPRLGGPELARPLSAVRRWRVRRRTREARRAARRAEVAAHHAALLGRLDSVERHLRELDETVTKQLGELEPRLLHAFELRSQGLERELASLVPQPAAAAGTDERRAALRAIHPALPAGFGVVVFALGVWFARCLG